MRGKKGNLIILLIIVLICSVSIISFSISIPYIFNTHTKPKVLVILRYDDYSTESERYIERKILIIAGKYNHPLSFAAVPVFNNKEISNETISFIKPYIENGSVEITQHGFDHVGYTYIEEFNSYSEFIGKTKENQNFTISNGKKLLEEKFGTNITTFVPPYNSYDEITLDVLEDLNFSVISASYLKKNENEELNFTNLHFFHCKTVLDNNTINRIIDIQEESKEEIIIFPLYFHSYNFKDSALNWTDSIILDLIEFESICRWIYEDPDVSVVTFETATLFN